MIGTATTMATGGKRGFLRWMGREGRRVREGRRGGKSSNDLMITAKMGDLGMRHAFATRF